jgi:glycosyltransferase involved in cell wall biosynthesis
VDRRPFKRITYIPVLAAYVLLHGREFDLVHVHLANFQADVVALVAAVIRRPFYVKIAAGGTGGDVLKMRPVTWLTRRIGLRRAAVIQVLSNEIEGELLAVGIRPDKLVRIPNGLDLAGFWPASPAEKIEARRQLGIPETAPVALYVGRFSVLKGVPDLLAAWRRADVSDGLLLLLGAGRHTDHLVDDLGSDETVRAVPFSSEPRLYYHAADVFVLASQIEGMSNALLEAMACGLPAVVTDIGAAAELVQDGRTGFVVAPRDMRAFAERLRSLLLDPAQREAFGDAAREHVHRYAIAAVVDAIEQQYRVIVRRT